jgi:sugar lactone lactonase YvrE
MKTKIAASLLLLVCFAASGAPGALARPNKDVFPEVIPLPTSWGPEGIATGRGTEFFAGARQGSPFQGAIYKGDLRTGEGSILVQPQPGRFALGLKLDRRSNLLFVAGGPSGSGFIYDADTGANVAAVRFTTSASFINDVVVTRDAAYFTDSLNPFIYALPLGPGGKVPASPTFTALPLTGDFLMTPGFNLNGIVATPDGKSLIVVQSSTGLLYRVDPLTGQTELIDLGGARLTNADGLWLDGRTLYVVRNRLNQIAVVELDRDLGSGEYVDNLTSPYFDVPTTIAEFGNSLYAVNARFTTPIPGAAYQVVRVSK